MHHLLIMEELGGNSWWFDRFLAQHIAIVYYFMTVLMYVISPRMDGTRGTATRKWLQFQVFFTSEGKGWGLRTLEEPPKGFGSSNFNN
ncbi:hypothetical protein K1719_040292 [Acacia pycnantha]|nr:hypothetical protein K1719_040292 [Acacia pycnantha]